jgi:hypothetical protein
MNFPAAAFRNRRTTYRSVSLHTAPGRVNKKPCYGLKGIYLISAPGRKRCFGWRRRNSRRAGFVLSCAPSNQYSISRLMQEAALATARGAVSTQEVLS